jgi:hypothetical protein
MLWPSASEMLTSERITEQENIAAEDCMGKQIKYCSRGLHGKTKKMIATEDCKGTQRKKYCSRGLQRLDRGSGF